MSPQGRCLRREPGGSSTERDFYLREFRGRTLLFALSAGVEAGGLARLGETIAHLRTGGSRAVVLARRGLVSPRALGRVAGAGARRLRVRAAAGEVAEDTVRCIWEALRSTALCVLEMTGTNAAPCELGGRLAARLRVHKLVLVDPRGGLASRGRQLSFLDAAMLAELLREGEAESHGLDRRRALLLAARRALEAGVESVSICSPEGVAEELFTYEGSGTLFTLEDYCQVERLSIDDFPAAERLLERGCREGCLKPRGPEERGRLLAAAFGATIARRHLAGICALLTTTYRRERAGEVAGLYTLTRFKGEGIGARLLDRVVAEAISRGLRYLFACTGDDRARDFFARHGFEPVAPAAVPAGKWKDYDRRRRTRITVYRRWIGPGTGRRAPGPGMPGAPPSGGHPARTRSGTALARRPAGGRAPGASSPGPCRRRS